MIEEVKMVAVERLMVEPLNAAPGTIPLIVDVLRVRVERIGALAVPATSRVAAGVAVPIPTLLVVP
jgi:hypothetical protein